VCEVIDSL